MILARLNRTNIKNAFRIITSIWGRNITETSNLSIPYGIDCNPPQDEISVIAETGNNADNIVIGFVTKEVLDDLSKGEIGLYSKDANGNIVATIKLRNNGKIEFSSNPEEGQTIGSEDEIIKIGGEGDHMVRYSKLAEAFNELQEKFNDLVAAYNNHVHTSAAPGSPTTPPTTLPAEDSESSIAPSKIDNVETNTGE